MAVSDQPWPHAVELDLAGGRVWSATQWCYQWPGDRWRRRLISGDRCTVVRFEFLDPHTAAEFWFLWP